MSEQRAEEHIRQVNQLLKNADRCAADLNVTVHPEDAVRLQSQVVAALAALAAIHITMAEWELG